MLDVMAKETHLSKTRLVGTMRHDVDLGAAVGTRGRNTSSTLGINPRSPVSHPVRDNSSGQHLSVIPIS